MPTYRNKTNQTLVIPQVGSVEPGQTIESPKKLESPNLEEISSQQTTQPEQPKEDNE